MAEVVTVAGVGAWVEAFRERVTAQAAYLTELDSAIGDGDHGINMERGMNAAGAAVAQGLADGSLAAIGPLFSAVGMKLVSTVGGAAGPLYGTMFLRMATGLADKAELELAGLTDALGRGLEGLRSRGKALAGDKTMIDALTPAVDALLSATASGAGLSEALGAARTAAEAGAEATAPLLARKGRASYLGERSIGHIDPGAASMALLIGAAADTLGA
jgi:dihydroxyacetone kinase-like protein